MDTTTQIVNRVLPILFLIGLGAWIRRSHFLSERTVEDLKKIAVYLALPAVLFVSFLKVDLQPAYLVTFVLVFGLCLALYGLGVWLRPRLAGEHPTFPFLMTGFEYGMLGVSLFGTAYGLENIGAIAIIDLGHEIFIWFVFLALLLMRRDGLRGPGQLAGAFFRSPVILAILAGLAGNVLGASDFLYNSPVTGALMDTLGFLSALTVPLILIIVGYGIQLDRAGIRAALPVIGARLAVLVPVGAILILGVVRGLLGLGRPFEAALFTLLVLPPPFIIPLYMPDGGEDEQRYVNNVLTLYTIVSVALFSLYLIFNPGL